MKPGTLTSRRIWLPVLALGLIVALVSWDRKQNPAGTYQQDPNPADTTPKKKKIHTDRKVRDLDEVLAEMESVNMDMEMKNVDEELAKALKQIDGEKIRLEVEKAMKDVDFTKLKTEIESAMKEIDLEKIKMEVQESVAKIDFDKIKAELEQVKKTDFREMEVEMKKMQEELRRIKPEIEKEMANVKVEMEKAKVEIEKAKAEIKEYKTFVDALNEDGLINKKESYSIKHKDGELTINGKKADAAVYTKYSSFLEKHKKFNIEKSKDDFDIDMD